MSKRLEDTVSSINKQRPQPHEGLSKEELGIAVNQYVSDFTGKFEDIIRNYLATFITATVPSIGATGRMNLRRNKEKRIPELCINMSRKISPTAQSRRSRTESGMRKGDCVKNRVGNSCGMKEYSYICFFLTSPASIHFGNNPTGFALGTGCRGGWARVILLMAAMHISVDLDVSPLLSRGGYLSACQSVI